MIDNILKTKLARNEPIFGLLSPNADPQLIEMIGLLGFDFYMVDCEHGTASLSEVENLVRACEVRGLVPLARVPNLDPKWILRFLDAGIMGIMMPGIRQADEIRLLVEAVRYPPLGKRGLGPVRVADFFLGKETQAEYVAWANNQILILPQIETAEAVEHLSDLVRVEGVDGFIVGPRDLSMSLGFTDGVDHAEMRQTIDRVFSTVIAAGKTVGTVAATGARAAELIEKDARIILHSVSGLLQTGAKNFFKYAKTNAGSGS